MGISQMCLNDVCSHEMSVMFRFLPFISHQVLGLLAFYKVLGPIVIESALPRDMKLGTVKNFVKVCVQLIALPEYVS